MPVNRLMKFVELCKACGVTISPSESVAFTNDVAHIVLEDKMLLEEATVACLAKDNESEAIVRKLFRLFFTGRPEEEQEEESDADYEQPPRPFDALTSDSQLARALQEALESGELRFDTEISTSNEVRRRMEARVEAGAPPRGPRLADGISETSSDIEPSPSAETDISTEQPQHQSNTPSPRIQAAPTHHPQMRDRTEINRELAQFMHDNLSGRDLERIIELLEDLNEMQHAARGAQNERLENLLTDSDTTMEQQVEQPDSIGSEPEESEDTEAAESTNEQSEDLSTGADMMAEQEDEQEGLSGGQAEDEESGPSLQPQQGDDGMGAGKPRERKNQRSVFLQRGGNRAPGSSRGNPAQRRGDVFDTQNMEGPDVPRFNMPLSLEAAQTLAAAFVQELVMGNAAPPLGGRLARLMNPEQGGNFAQQHQMALELWMLTDREREQLLRSLEYVVGRLLLQDCITPEEFAEYSALFDEQLKAQTTIAGAGAETHLENVDMLAALLTRYKSEAPLLGVIVSRLSTAMHRLLSRRMPIYTKSTGGKLDVRKTIRQSMQYGGIPMEFIYREKALWEDIVLALDTSGSQVWWAVSAMLFARAFEKTARRLRVYSFTSDIEDVTKYIPHPEKFVEHLDDFAGYSNYETSFQELLSKAPISARTTLIIVGDCRDYQGSWKQKSPDKYGQRIGPHSAKLMGKLVKRSHKVIILNPEEKLKWGVGDSAILDYEQAGATVKYVTSPLNLAEQLMSV